MEQDFEAFVAQAWPRLLRSAWLLTGHAEVELRHALAQALRRLPDRQRAVVVLRYHGDLTEADTAKALGLSIGTVKSYTHRALATLRADPRLRGVLSEERRWPWAPAPACSFDGPDYPGVRWTAGDLTYELRVIPNEGDTDSLADVRGLIDEFDWP